MKAQSSPRERASALEAAFDSATPYTVGLEDEVMLLSPETLELVPRAPDVMSLLDGDSRFKLELPASQIEILTPALAHVHDAAFALLEARRALAAQTGHLVRLGGCGVHPFSSGVGELNRLPRYERTISEYGSVARRQLVCALQVHVAAGDSARTLAVYNAGRSYLPLLAALAANAPFYEGHDTGLASVRPKLAGLLPRQGIPPPIRRWDDYAEIAGWGEASETFADMRAWWWELRLQPRFGTLEFRVPDAQGTVADAAAIAAVIQALVAWLGDRHDRGEQLPIAPSWRIDENRWSAARHGVEGTLADLQTGAVRETRACLKDLLDQLEPIAIRLEAASALEHARGLIDVNGAIAQRRVAASGGTRAVVQWLVERFSDSPVG